MNEKEQEIYDDCNWKNSQRNNTDRVLEKLKLALSSSPIRYSCEGFPNTPLFAERFNETIAWIEKYFNEMKPKIIQEQVNVIMSGNPVGLLGSGKTVQNLPTQDDCPGDIILP